MGFDLLDPVFNIIESRPIINGISKDNPHSSPIVGLGDSFKALLTSGVPDLQFDPSSSKSGHFGFEVDAWMRGEVPIVVR